MIKDDILFRIIDFSTVVQAYRCLVYLSFVFPRLCSWNLGTIFEVQGKKIMSRDPKKVEVLVLDRHYAGSFIFYVKKIGLFLFAFYFHIIRYY